MQWFDKKEIAPKIGDVRHRYIFAWFPTKIDWRYVWLETYGVTETYKYRYPVLKSGRYWSIDFRFTDLKNHPFNEKVKAQRKRRDDKIQSIKLQKFI